MRAQSWRRLVGLLFVLGSACRGQDAATPPPPTSSAAAAKRVDQAKFDALYRAGKAIEVDIANSSSVRVAESEKLLKQLRTEIALLEGRTDGEREEKALQAYSEAAEAYNAFLDIRDLDLQGRRQDGRMLLGDGWVAKAKKFDFPIGPSPAKESGKFKFYWVNIGTAVEALLSATKKSLTEANGIVNARD